MTSVAKTNQNVKFDPTNYNKMFENAKLNSSSQNFNEKNNKELRPRLVDNPNNYLDNTSEYDIYSVKRNYNWKNNHQKPVDSDILYTSIIFIVFGIFLLIFSKFIR